MPHFGPYVATEEAFELSFYLKFKLNPGRVDVVSTEEFQDFVILFVC